MPPPMHSVARPFFAPRFCISNRSVVRTRAPDAPIGWPMAMAPPFTFTIAGSQPMSLLTAMACAAKASLASTRSRSLTFQPAFSSALRDAGIGPDPMTAGSTPAVAQETIFASGVRPRFLASSALINTSAAAPSLRPEALPAVTVPSLLKAGFSLAIASSVVPGRIYSSWSTMTSPFLDGDGNDLVPEPAGLLRILGLVLRAGGKRVLLYAADLPFGGDVLRGDAHVIAVEGVQQAILQHGVDELGVAHLGAVAHM